MAIREELVLDLTRARADAAAFEQELAEVTIGVALDDQATRAEFAALQSRLEGEDVSLGVDVDESAAATEYAALQARLEADRIQATVDVDTVAASAEIAALDPEAIEVPVNVDTTAATAELELLDPEAIEVPVIVDTAEAQVEIAALDREPVEVPVHADTTDAQAEIAGLGGGTIDGGDVAVNTQPAQDQIGLLGFAMGQVSQKASGFLGGAGGAGGALSGLTAAAGKAVPAVAALAGPLAVVAAGFVAVKEASDFFTENVDEAAAFEQAMAKALNVFGDLGPEAAAAMTDVADSMLLSDTAALQMGSTLGNLFIAMGLTNDEALNMSEGVLTLAADLSSFNDVPVGEVLEALRAGLIGETEPLRRFGVAISQARLEQAALSQGLIEQGETLTAQQSVLLRYQLIMEDTALAQGDVARSSGQLTIEQAKNAAAFENLATTAGTFVIPAFAGVTEAIGNDLIPALTDLVRVVGPVMESVSGAVAVFAEDTIAFISNVADEFEDLFRFGERIALTVVGDADTAAFLDVQAQLDEMLESAPEADDAVADILDTLDDPRWGDSGVVLTIEQLKALGEQAGLTSDELIDVIGARIDQLRNQISAGTAPAGAQDQLDALTLAYRALTIAAEGGNDAIENTIGFVDNLNAAGGGSKWGITAREIASASRVAQDALSELDVTRFSAVVRAVGSTPITVPPVDLTNISTSLGAIDGIILSLAPSINIAGAELGRSLTSGFEAAVAGAGAPSLTPMIDGLLDPGAVTRLDAVFRDMFQAVSDLPDLLGVVNDKTGPKIEALVERIHLMDAIPQVIRDAADGVAGGVDQLTTVLEEGGPEVALSADMFVENLGESVAQATEWSDNLKALAKRGQEDLAAELLALGPAAADITEQFVEDASAAEEGERILDEAGRGWVDDGLKPAIEETMGNLEADNPILAGFLGMTAELDSPEMRNRIATLLTRIYQEEAANAAAAALGATPSTPSGGTGGGGTGGGSGGGGGGGSSGPPTSGPPTGPPTAQGPTAGVNLTINNPTARDIEEESGRLAQIVAAVGGLLSTPA